MHRSRIGVILIDLPDEHFASAAAFWHAATGGQRVAHPDASGAVTYESLDPLGGGVKLELQRTGAATPPRLHLDVETDDVPAEVARLGALGATVHEHRDGYTVMNDPAGLVFCVVPVQTGADFERRATKWDASDQRWDASDQV